MMDQPHANAALGIELIRTIGRDELKAKLDRGADFKLIVALNRWAYDSKHIPGSSISTRPRRSTRRSGQCGRSRMVEEWFDVIEPSD